MESLFNVVFTGELKPGTERDTFITAFSQRFQCSEAKAAELLDAGKAATMKNAVTKDVAEKFRGALEELGMTIRLEPLPAKTAPSQPEPSQTASPDTSTTNPYQSPQADLHDSYEEGEMTGPVSVPIGHGTSWIGTAYSNHFKGNALAWIGAFVVLVILSMVLQIIPLLGPLAYALLSPVFAGGMMLGARAQDEGEDFTVGHLFSGFKQSTGQLVMIGVLYLVASILILVFIGVMMGGSMAMLGMMMGMEDPAATEAMVQDPTAILLPILLMLLLFIPLMMAYWFAPALVAIDGISALSAMKMSFVGCIKNILPFLLYSIVMLILMVVAAIPLFLGYLVVLPLMIATMYTAYRDIYYPEA
jgi:uncharacterized membrane protein